jgi:hypothetical protein
MNIIERFLDAIITITVYITIIIKYVGRTFLSYEALFLFAMFIIILLLAYFVIWIMYAVGLRGYISITDFFDTVFSKYLFSSSYNA